ncbi:hypothetical protein GGI07_000814 [Coemansia sp. Benny D115]|nr:hypothetical protein GGI07_000814 [Coemansia sp. Benny D115]
MAAVASPAEPLLRPRHPSNARHDTCAPPRPAWWLSSDTEHAHTACPLRPFAHMVVALPMDHALHADAPDADTDADADADDCCAIAAAIPSPVLANAQIVHLSEALRRKMHGAADARGECSVGDMLRFMGGDDRRQQHPLGQQPHPQQSRPATVAGRARAASAASLWGVLGWLVGSSAWDDATSETEGADPADAEPEAPSERLYRRRAVATCSDDDPLLVGNEGLGAVETAEVRIGNSMHPGATCVFALCAHAMSAGVQTEWLAWRRAKYGVTAAWHARHLAVVHVAEVSTLHRAASSGLDALLPPALPLAEIEHSMARAARNGSGCSIAASVPPLPPLAIPATVSTGRGSGGAVRWLALLLSRHGLVEMAHPLARTRLELSGDDIDDRATEILPVALGGWLGESLFTRIHPEDVLRTVRALRVAWDARPDVYHYARLRRQWRRRGGSGGSSPSASSFAAAEEEKQAAALRRQELRRDGIECSNGSVELTVQLRLSGAGDLDWMDADAAALHTRFARVRMTRWPLVVKPPRSSAATGGASGEASDGFVLLAMRPLPEPSGARVGSAKGLGNVEYGSKKRL